MADSSKISQYLERIKTATFGKDVRQAIHDGIKQCYSDGKAGSIDLEGREKINECINLLNNYQNPNISLGLAIDGKLYVFLDGVAQGTGIDLKAVGVDDETISELITDGLIFNLDVREITPDKSGTNPTYTEPYTNKAFKVMGTVPTEEDYTDYGLILGTDNYINLSDYNNVILNADITETGFTVESLIYGSIVPSTIFNFGDRLYLTKDGTVYVPYIKTDDSTNRSDLSFGAEYITPSGKQRLADIVSNEGYCHLVLRGNTDGTVELYLNGYKNNNTRSISDFKSFTTSTLKGYNTVISNSNGVGDVTFCFIHVYSRALSDEEMQSNLKTNVSTVKNVSVSAF